jgi:hypothetical protein
MTANGTETLPSLTPEQMAKLAEEVQKMEPEVFTVILTMVAGLIARGEGKYPPMMVMNMIAWKCGNVLANMVQGDISTNSKLRHGFIEAFREGVNKAPIVNAVAGGAVSAIKKAVN